MQERERERMVAAVVIASLMFISDARLRRVES